MPPLRPLVDPLPLLVPDTEGDPGAGATTAGEDVEESIGDDGFTAATAETGVVICKEVCDSEMASSVDAERSELTSVRPSSCGGREGDAVDIHQDQGIRRRRRRKKKKKQKKTKIDFERLQYCTQKNTVRRVMVHLTRRARRKYRNTTGTVRSFGESCMHARKTTIG